MLNNLKKLIESKRNSPNWFWRFLVWFKDLVWGISRFQISESKIAKYVRYKIPVYDYTNLSALKPIQKYAFVFVCQEGKLEIESVLLAASLKKFLKCDYELIAAVPQPEELLGRPKELTLEILKKMGVKIVHIYNGIIAKGKLAKGYLYTNKAYCFRIATLAEKIIFLDSDTLLIKEFFGDWSFTIPFNALFIGQVDALYFQGKWQRIFDLAGVELPPLRFKVGEDSKYFPLYVPISFHERFIAINTNFASQLSGYWLKFFKKIDSKIFKHEDNLFASQIALSLAVHKMKIPYCFLMGREEKLFVNYKKKKKIENYPLLDSFGVEKSFINYKDTARIKNYPLLNSFVKSLITDYSDITKLIRGNSEWEFLLKD